MVHRSNASPRYVSFNEGSLLSPALSAVRTLHQLPSGRVSWCCWLAKPCSQSLPGCSPCEHHGHPTHPWEFVFPGLEQRWDTVLYCSSCLWEQKVVLSLVLHHYLHEAVSPHFCVLSVLRSILRISLLQLTASSQTEELLSLPAFQVREPAAILTQDPSYYRNTQFVHIAFGVSLG